MNLIWLRKRDPLLHPSPLGALFCYALTVFPKHLILHLSFLHPWCFFLPCEKFSKSLKKENTDKHPHGTNLVTWIGEKIFLFLHAGCSSTGNNWCKRHILQHVSVHRAPAQILAAAAVAVRKLICGIQDKVMKQWRLQTLLLCRQTKCLLVLHAWVF